MTVIHRERDYLERTIKTVRNHRDADNCWPSWANIFADEIERAWSVEELVDRALLYRSCGRFDREPCRDRPEIEESKWCAWCKLASERGIEHT